MPSFWENPIAFIAEWLRSVLTGWGVPAEGTSFILALLGAFTIALLAMLFTIFLIWYERKLLGRIQDRLGPNRVGPWGIFQSFADMLKIFTKEYITPDGADVVPYNLAPVLSVAAVLLLWAVLPFTSNIVGVDLEVGLLYVIAVGGFSEISIMLAGLGSNNKYALLGGFRAVAMLVSYEVPMVISLLVVAMLAGSLNLMDIVNAQVVPFILLAPVAAFIYFITQIAESGRSPFDVVEAESELVAGFMTEYSGLKFGMFYVADFLHAFTGPMLFSTLFLGGWRGPWAEQVPLLGLVYLVIKTFLVYFIGLLLRGSLPRFRIDQMLDLNWKILTPLSLIAVFLTALVDKSLQAVGVVGDDWTVILLRTVVLLVVNAVVLWFTLRLMSQNIRPVRAIVSRERPLATNQDQVSA